MQTDLIDGNKFREIIKQRQHLIGFGEMLGFYLHLTF